MSEPVEAAREALDAAEERRQLIERRKLAIRQQLATMAKSRVGHRGRPDRAHSSKKRRLEAHLIALDEGRLPEEPAPKPPRPKLSGAALGDAVSNKAGICAAPARAPKGATARDARTTAARPMRFDEVPAGEAELLQDARGPARVDH